jgi:ABC-type multidrug transport system fused ATPase/permease subunit
LEEKREKYSVFNNLLFVIRGIKEFDRELLGLMTINAIFQAVGPFVPVLMPKYIFDELTGRGSARAIISIVLIWGFVMSLSMSISQTTLNSVRNRFIRVRLCFIARFGKKFMTMDFQGLEDPDVLDLSQRGDRACNDNQNGLEGMMHRLLSIFSRTFLLFGCGGIIVMLHPAIILALCTLLTVNFIASSRARRRDKEINDALVKVRRKLNYTGRIMSDFSYGKDIRLFGMKDRITEKYLQEQNSWFDGSMRIQKLWLQVRNISSLTNLFQEVLLYTWLCWRVIKGEMGIGDFTMYAGAIRSFSSTLGGLLDDISHIRQQNQVVSDFRAFLDYPDESLGFQRLPEDLIVKGCTLEFENVSFRYPGSKEYVLKDVSITINAGQRLAIVGLNGAGKSTFVKLMTRLYEPEEGRILLNGVDVRNYDKREYYRLFSVVFQEIQMFAFTVAENVSMSEYGKIDFFHVASCLEKVGIGEKIRALPKGIETSVFKVIDEDGIEFSGGENQKLLLARALYKDAPVVILDEPTAALDALAEEQLYGDFDRLIGDKTAVYISHRLSSTRFCDGVVMFEDGRIIERGTHKELMDRDGRYAELFTLQAKYYKEVAHIA